MVEWMPILAIVLVIAVTLAFTVLFARGLNRGPRGRGEVDDEYLAVARCARCGSEYECEWIPFVSFSALRAGLQRYQRCRACGRLAWATFERWASSSPPRVSG